MIRYLDPKYDLTFKRVFGEHKHLCISLINSMLPFEQGREVVSIEYQTGELVPQIPALRNSIVDVRCTDNYGRQFIVEMQMEWTEMFKKRVLFNASKAYVLQLDRAEKIELLQPVYSLNFINHNFELLPEIADRYYHHYKIVNMECTRRQIEGLEFVFIELKKFKSEGKATRKLQELWLRFLTEINENTSEAPQELLSNRYTEEAVGYMELAAFSKEQLTAYDKIKIDSLTAQSMFLSAKEDGIAEGIAEGIALGLEKGIAQGIEKGIAQGIEKGVAQGIEKGLAEGEAERQKLHQAVADKELQLAAALAKIAQLEQKK
jgi:predicted transposase/invertase (TIGR01784 family)